MLSSLSLEGKVAVVTGWLELLVAVCSGSTTGPGLRLFQHLGKLDHCFPGTWITNFLTLAPPIHQFSVVFYKEF